MLLFAACYKDGPIISFRSKEKRLLNEWRVTNLTINGVDSTQYYNDSCGCGIKFYKDLSETKRIHIFSCKSKNSGANISFGGIWSFDVNNTLNINLDGDEIFHFIGPIAPGKYSLKILKLTIDKFWFECKTNNKEYLFKLS